MPERYIPGLVFTLSVAIGWVKLPGKRNAIRGDTPKYDSPENEAAARWLEERFPGVLLDEVYTGWNRRLPLKNQLRTVTDDGRKMAYSRLPAEGYLHYEGLEYRLTRHLEKELRMVYGYELGKEGELEELRARPRRGLSEDEKAERLEHLGARVAHWRGRRLDVERQLEEQRARKEEFQQRQKEAHQWHLDDRQLPGFGILKPLWTSEGELIEELTTYRADNPPVDMTMYREKYPRECERWEAWKMAQKRE
jgi:hypothetical protein